MQAISSVSFFDASTIGGGFVGADGFRGDALRRISSLHGDADVDDGGDDVGGGFLNTVAWRFFCFLFGLSAVAVGGFAVWWWFLDGKSTAVSSAGDLAAMIVFFEFSFCVVRQMCLVLLCAVCVLLVQVATGLPSADNVAEDGRKIFYQLVALMPGWSLDPTFSGGLHTFMGVFLSGELGLTMLVASDSFYTGDGSWPARSTSPRLVGFPVLLLLVPSNFEASSSGRWPASRCFLRLTVTGTTGCSLQGFGCNFVFFQGCLCKGCYVNYQK